MNLERPDAPVCPLPWAGKGAAMPAVYQYRKSALELWQGSLSGVGVC